MGRNVGLLEATMTQIVDHPELHDQSWFFAKGDCGTAACFAGWACLLSGLQEVFSAPDIWISNATVNVSAVVKMPDGSLGSAADEAQSLLGITRDESHTLFDVGNTRRMLELMTKDLVNGDVLQSYDHYREEGKK